MLVRLNGSGHGRFDIDVMPVGWKVIHSHSLYLVESRRPPLSDQWMNAAPQGAPVLDSKASADIVVLELGEDGRSTDKDAYHCLSKAENYVQTYYRQNAGMSRLWRSRVGT